MYRLMGPINVVTAVEVCAYKATYQYQDPAYTPEFVQFSVGFSPTEFRYQSPRFMFPEKDASTSVSLQSRSLRSMMFMWLVDGLLFLSRPADLLVVA